MLCYRLLVPQAVLGLGSNLGARRALLRCASTLLAAQPGLTVLARSALYETPPLGPPQPDYLNAALRIAWRGGLEGLLRVCQHVEQLLGRERRERWGPRTIDIDLLHWSEGAVHTPWVDVPHLGLRERPFALAPLLDVQPELAREYGPILSRLGGAPTRANPGWLDLTRAPTRDDGLTPADDSPRSQVLCSATVPTETPQDELACLAVSAVGACARAPRPARASLFFASSEPPLRDGTSFLVARVAALAKLGFCACDAAITGTDEGGTRGYVIGEHRAAPDAWVLPRVLVQPANGLTRTLWAFAPTEP